MISEKEKLLTMEEAARVYSQIHGTNTHPLTVWRWCRKGFKGVHLKYFRAGRRIKTTENALIQFGKDLVARDMAECRNGNQTCYREVMH